MGGKLGTLFAHAGHEVVFSYARSKEKLNRLAREARGNARYTEPLAVLIAHLAYEGTEGPELAYRVERSFRPHGTPEARSSRAKQGRGQKRTCPGIFLFFDRQELLKVDCDLTAGRCTDYGRHSSLCALASRSFRFGVVIPIYRGSLTYNHFIKNASQVV